MSNNLIHTIFTSLSLFFIIIIIIIDKLQTFIFYIQFGIRCTFLPNFGLEMKISKKYSRANFVKNGSNEYGFIEVDMYRKIK